MFRLLLLVLTSLNAGITHGSKQWHKTVSRLTGEYPTINNFFNAHTLQSPHKFLEGEALDRVNYLLRFVNIPDTSPLKGILDGVSYPALRTDPSYDGIRHLLQQDPEKTAEMFTNYMKRVYQRDNALTSQERVYQECAKDYDSFVAPITNPLIRLIFDPCEETNGTSPCYNATLPTFTQYPEGRLMIDAMFKIPEALLEGKLHWPAAYEACLDIQADYDYNVSDVGYERRQYDGKYARLHLRLDALTERNITALVLLLGVCVPSSCNEEHVRRYLLEVQLDLRNLLAVTNLPRNINILLSELPFGPESNETCQLNPIQVPLTSAQRPCNVSFYKIHFLLPKNEELKTHLTEDNLLTKVIIRDVLQMDITEVFQGRKNDVTSDSLIKFVFALISLLGGLMLAASVYEYWFRHKVVMRDLKAIACEHDRSMANGRKEKPQLRRLSSLASVSSQADLLSTLHSSDVDLPKYPLRWEHRLEAVFVSFSMLTSFRRIFTIEIEPHHLRVIDGVKVFMFGWYIVGETAIFGITYTEVWTTQNLFAQLQRWPKVWYLQIVPNYSLVSDVFLCFSGLFVSYHWFRKLNNKTPSLEFACKFLLNRVWTFWLPLAFTLIFYVALSPYWPDGPLLPAQIQDAENCKESWWATLLFINNLVKVDKPCMIWTSQLALLVQFHVFAITILIPLSIKSTIGGPNVMPFVAYGIMGATFVASFIASIVITSNSVASTNGSWYKDYLLAPWCRIGPYLIGMVAGIVIYWHKYKGFNPNVEGSTARIVLMWLSHGVAAVLIFFPMFITHVLYLRDFKFSENKAQVVAWHTGSPVSIALGIAWFTVWTEMGHKGAMGRLLSGRWWLPYTRLMFQAYLVHVPITFGYFYLRSTTLYLQLYNLVYQAVANMLISMAVGCIAALAWQYPLVFSLKKVLSLKDVYSWVENGRNIYNKN
ncbi:hypothetical protein CAPTEDRAFT_189005 [Capitella teleta]|uniref:Nose resistant-to-fluoxetine protein N-terminal domain-containing protein n=1 Tax=Capitella teleta TaxID=283909 RepID=R7ULP1_CAPTE|nr:hypothetical protein CAPTEDRAFT_189005 [Capitella teleta]|eukprot:ELU07110.1 hypothetical protein CAPTEDRAFT_189005 [Capitella teleta]